MRDTEKDIQRASEILGFKVPIDGFFTVVMGRKCIDIVKFHEKIKKEHTDYTDETNMTDFLIKEYGSELNDIIDRLI